MDLDLGLTNLGSIAESLNETQQYFHFMCPEMPSLKKAVVTIEKIKHLAVFKVPKSFIAEHRHLSVDLISCLTRFPLAFLEKGYVYYNYFAGPSNQDERFLFVSTDQLYEFCKRAGRRFEEGLVHTLVGQLTAYFTTIGYHDETRGCVMDFCEMREKQILGLKARKYCDDCEHDFPDGDLKNSLKTMLSWRY